MTDNGKYAVAVFFIPRKEDDTNASILELLNLAGAIQVDTRPVAPSDTSGLVLCTWAGMTCRAYLANLEEYQVLHMFFFRSILLDLLGDPPEHPEDFPLEKDGALQIALAFQDACVALSPEVGFIAVRRNQGDPDWTLERAWMVLAKDANALADEHFGLLYLNQEISTYWSSNPALDDRDSLPVPSGRLVFAGRGWRRWF